MKLPDIKYRSVETVGRHDLGALGAVANAVGQKGRVMQQGMEAVSAVTEDYLVRKQNAEYDDQIASMQIEFSEWNTKYGAKDFFTSEEVVEFGLSDHLIDRFETTTDDGGRQVTLERKSIPAYEVYPHILSAKLAGMTADKVEKISNPMLREEFERKAAVNEANLNMQAAFNAENQQEKFILEKGILEYQNAADRGDAIAALFYIDGLATDDLHKEKLVQDAYYRAEFSDVSSAIRSNEPETVMAMLSMLTDPQYSGYLSEDERQAGVRSLDVKLKLLGAEQSEEWDRLQGIEYARDVEEIKSGNGSLAAIQEKFELHVIDPDNPDGYDVPQYERAMGLQRAYEQSVIVEDRRIETENRRLAKEEEARQKAGQVLKTKQEKVVNVEFVANLDEGIDNGVVHLIDLERAREDYVKGIVSGVTNPNSIDGGQYTTLRRRIIARDKKLLADNEKFMIGYDIIHNKADSSREYSGHQAGIDQYVKQMGITEIPALVKITQDTNIMPQLLENMVVNSALNSPEGEGVDGLTVYGSLLESNKHALLDLSSTTRDLMDSAWYLHSVGGMSGKESLIIANEISQMPPAEREENQITYKALDAYDGNISFLNKKMSADEDRLYPFDAGWFTNAIGSNAQMGAAYQYLVATEFERTANLDMSRNTAWNKVTEIWSPSGVGVRIDGLTISKDVRPDKYGVERTLGITTDIANDRLAAFAIANGLDIDSVIVRADPFTAVERENISWDIMVIDPVTMNYDRVYDTDNGLPLRWIPNNWIEQGKEYGYRKAVEKAKSTKQMREAIESQPLDPDLVM